MRKQTAIVTDTNSGLRPEEAAGLGIDLIPMPVNLDGESFFEYDTITQAEFFSCRPVHPQGLRLQAQMPAR